MTRKAPIVEEDRRRKRPDSGLSALPHYRPAALLSRRPVELPARRPRIAGTLDIVPEDPQETPPAEPRPAETSPADSSTAPPEVTPNPSVELTTNGVGPWRGEPPTDDVYDPQLLTAGDSRNVIDRYRYWRMDAIVADLDLTRHPFHVAIENWQHDMNIGSIVRSANAFAADTVHIIGRKRWNKRGAMVTDRYQHVMYHPDVAAFAGWAKDAALPVIAIDNGPGSVVIETYRFPAACILLFGQEGPGLSAEALGVADAIVEISQFGSTRSLNASAAAAVAMHAWVTQHAKF
jgi:tRNA(Leu) C34 or U34 (ribose-2'-O)-methylase TrmL